MIKRPWMRFDFFASAFFDILSAFLDVALAFTLMAITDAAIAQDFSALIFALIVSLCIFFGMFIVGPSGRFFTYRYIKHYALLSKETLYNNTIKGFKSKMDNNIAKYSTDTDIIINNYYFNQPLIIGAAARFAFSIAGIIFIDWRMFLAVLVLCMLPMIAPALFQKRISRTTKIYSEKSKEYLNHVTDSMEGLYEIKSFSAQGFFSKIHQKLNIAAEKARISNRFANFMLQVVSMTLGSFVFVGIIGFGGFLAINDIVTVGALIATIQMLNGVVNPISQIGSYIGEIKGAKELAASYFEKPEEDGGVPAPEFTGSINVSNVSFTYPEAEKPVLNGFSAGFNKGGTYAIVGESGCGKSTLAKILAGVLPCEGGKVEFAGVDIAAINPDSYSQKVSYIHQASHLFNMSIKDNVEFGQNRADFEASVKNLGLEDMLANRSEDDIISNRDHVSGGQKQRIVLARALNNKPDVLILDEPTANLDIESAINIIKYLKDIEGLTLIIITHADNPEIIKIFDNVITMKVS